MHNINEPWEAQIDWAPDFPRGSHVFDGHGNEIATNVDGFQATLIAAAPDLLAALEQVTPPTFFGETAERIAFYKSARAAIKKAKGT